MQQKLFLVSSGSLLSSNDYNTAQVQGWLDAGWRVIMISQPSNNNLEVGKWLVVLEK